MAPGFTESTTGRFLAPKHPPNPPAGSESSQNRVKTESKQTQKRLEKWLGNVPATPRKAQKVKIESKKVKIESKKVKNESKKVKTDYSCVWPFIFLARGVARGRVGQIALFGLHCQKLAGHFWPLRSPNSRPLSFPKHLAVTKLPWAKPFCGAPSNRLLFCLGGLYPQRDRQARLRTDFALFNLIGLQKGGRA